MTTETRLSERIAEPADGGRYVLEDDDGELRIVYRDDYACRNLGQLDEHWFHDANSDPMSWENITKYAVRMYSLTPYTGVASTGAPVCDKCHNAPAAHQGSGSKDQLFCTECFDNCGHTEDPYHQCAVCHDYSPA